MDEAQPIIFRVDRGLMSCDDRLEVVNPWPPRARISCIAIGPFLADEHGPVLVMRGLHVYVRAANASAVYYVREMTSEGDFICDLETGRDEAKDGRSV